MARHGRKKDGFGVAEMEEAGADDYEDAATSTSFAAGIVI